MTAALYTTPSGDTVGLLRHDDGRAELLHPDFPDGGVIACEILDDPEPDSGRVLSIWHSSTGDVLAYAELTKVVDL